MLKLQTASSTNSWSSLLVVPDVTFTASLAIRGQKTTFEAGNSLLSESSASLRTLVRCSCRSSPFPHRNDISFVFLFFAVISQAPPATYTTSKGWPFRCDDAASTSSRKEAPSLTRMSKISFALILFHQFPQ